MQTIFCDLGIDPASVHFDVHIVTPTEIRDLNRTHRGKDKVTDVLSFPMLDLCAGEIPTRGKFPNDVNPDTGKIELGDIVINEKERDKDELAAHGLLHLLGFHHDDDLDDH